MTSAYFIVDGLDECETESVELFLGFLQKIKKSNCAFKWILTSRNDFALQQHLPEYLDISLEANSTSVDDAVLEYIKVKVDRLAAQKHYTPELRDYVEERLRESADGTFLWVALACNELGATNIQSITTKKVLASLPAGLALIYGRMLEHVFENPDLELREFVVNILRCVTIALRPLTLQELGTLANLPLDHRTDERYIMDYTDQCGSFLSVRMNHATGLSTVYFVHQSAQEFLVNLPSGTPLTLNVPAEHLKIATFCLDHLCSDPSLHGLQYHIPVQGFQELFTEYATQFWMQHGKFAGEIFNKAIRPDHPFFSSNSPAWLLWESRFQPHPQSAALGRPFTGLQFGAYSGILTLVQRAYEWQGGKKALQDGKGEAALLQAAIEGHEEIMEFLVSKGVDVNEHPEGADPLNASIAQHKSVMAHMIINHRADVNAVDGAIGTSLQAAAAAGNIDVARTLLDKGADVNKRAGRLGNALRLAGRLGHTEMSELLLERSSPGSIDPASLVPGLIDACGKGNTVATQHFIDNGVLHAPEMDISSTMRAIAKSGQPECLQLLLQNGAPPASRFDDYSPPLLGAIGAGKIRSAELLLEYGAPADVETSWVFNRIHTPLLEAVTQGRADLVDTLLLKGANPNMVDSQGRAALHLVASNGYSHILPRLLDNGANIHKTDCGGRNATELALLENHRSAFRHLSENGGTYDAEWATLTCPENLKSIMAGEDRPSEEQTNLLTPSSDLSPRPYSLIQFFRRGNKATQSVKSILSDPAPVEGRRRKRRR